MAIPKREKRRNSLELRCTLSFASTLSLSHSHANVKLLVGRRRESDSGEGEEAIAGENLFLPLPTLLSRILMRAFNGSSFDLLSWLDSSVRLHVLPSVLENLNIVH